MYESKREDAYASVGVVNPELKNRLVNFAKIGFWIGTAALGVQLFMSAVYYTNL